MKPLFTACPYLQEKAIAMAERKPFATRPPIQEWLKAGEQAFIAGLGAGLSVGLGTAGAALKDPAKAVEACMLTFIDEKLKPKVGDQNHA